MKLKIALFFLSVLSLFGCTSMPQRNVTQASMSVHRIMTNDAIARLVSLYPPALTRFHIKQAAKDPFGISLIESLRQKGYSLNESSLMGTRAKGVRDLGLYYKVDELTSGRFYHVTFLIGTHSLSRAYKVKNGRLTPLGFWVRKE